MTDDNILYAAFLQHVSGNFTCVSALRLEMHVLSADSDLGALCSLNSGRDVNVRYAQYHLTPLYLADHRLQLFDQSLCLARGHVHLPVTSDNSLAISAIHIGFPLPEKSLLLK